MEVNPTNQIKMRFISSDTCLLQSRLEYFFPSELLDHVSYLFVMTLQCSLQVLRDMKTHTVVGLPS